MAIQIQLRRDTASNWTTANPTLAQGEAGYETDTSKIKIGDGTTAWNSLSYNFTSGTPSGAAGGDLSGTYPNPTVAKIQNRAIESTAPTNGHALVWNSTSSQWEAQSVGGGSGVTAVTVSASTLTLTAASNTYQIFSGSTDGQKVVLPDTTTMDIGDEYFLVNKSSTIIPVFLEDTTTLLGTLFPEQYLEVMVTDNSTSNGIWFKENAIPVNAEQSTLFDDFVYAGTASNAIGNLGWTLTSTNGTATWANQAVTSSRLGVGRLSTSNNNDAAGAIKLGTNLQTVRGGGIQLFETYVSIPTLGGTGAAAFTARIGIGDTTGTGDEANGIYFEYAGTAAGTINWSCKTASASTRTTTGSGVAVAAGTWYKLAAVADSSGTSVGFYINNNFITSISTNVPTTGIAPFIRIYSSATNVAAKSMDVDYYMFMKTFSTVR